MQPREKSRYPAVAVAERMKPGQAVMAGGHRDQPFITVEMHGRIDLGKRIEEICKRLAAGSVP